MGDQYAGDPSAYPVSFLVPDDADPPVASLGVSLEALGDRTAYLKSKTDALASSLLTFTASGTWECPPHVHSVDLRMSGAGGGGAGGQAGTGGAEQFSRGGGGGAGAVAVHRAVSVTPGVIYTIVVGASGAAGAAGANGGRGGHSQFTDGGALDVRALGGLGGFTYTGTTGFADTNQVTFVAAGGGARTTSNVAWKEAETPPHAGGHGGIAEYPPTAFVASAGGDSAECEGGAAGGFGAYGGSAAMHFGGGGGGGGGAGDLSFAGGVSNHGGSGGAGNDAGNGAAGAAGVAGSVGSGQGGGGGGGGGCGSTGGGAGGAGGAGGSGFVQLTFTAIP